MKPRKMILAVLAVCIGMVLLVACTQGTVAPQVVEVEKTADAPAVVEQEAESTLSVNATETVKAAPDIAYVYIGANTQAPTAEEAQAQNTLVTDAFVQAILGQGVAQTDIETSNISIYQSYDESGNYVVDNTYKVTIRDIGKAGAVIDAAVGAGANSTYSLTFDLSDRDAVYVEALGKAMQSIDAKAKAVAAAGGYTIVRVESIQENGTSSFTNDMMMESAAADAAGGTMISPGEIEVTAFISGVYVIQ